MDHWTITGSLQEVVAFVKSEKQYAPDDRYYNNNGIHCYEYNSMTKKNTTIEVTDINDKYGNVSLCQYDIMTQTKYAIIYNDVLLVSCDRYQLELLQQNLDIKCGIFIPSETIDNAEPQEFEKVISFGGIYVVKLEYCSFDMLYALPTNRIDFSDNFYTEHVDRLRIVLNRRYDPVQLEKILNKPCSKVEIYSKYNLVIRGPIFKKCNAKTIKFINVSLNKEARESIQHLDKLKIAISNGSVGFNSISCDNLHVSAYSGAPMDKKRFTISGNVKHVFIHSDLDIFVNSTTVESIEVIHGHFNRLFISGCENLQSLNYCCPLVIDEISAQNVHELDGTLYQSLDFFPRLEHLDTYHLHPLSDLSNLITLIFCEIGNVTSQDMDMYELQLLKAEKLEALSFHHDINDRWNSILLKLLQTGRFKELPYIDGIDIDDYPSIIFEYDMYDDSIYDKVKSHNERAKVRNVCLVDLS